jgi:cation diffusion facilitator family transporter
MNEKLALKLSALAYLAMAGLGIGFAIVARSDAIMLSGFFSLISFVMGLLSLKVADLVQQPGDEHFHFGYAHFEPFLNAIKGLIILAVCALSLAGAIDALLHGGRPLSAGWALLYAVIATVGCAAVAIIQHRVAKRVESPLLEVDVKNWTLDTAVNTGVGVAFLVALLLWGTRWSSVVPYVDSVLLIVLVLVLVWVPLKTVRDNVAELLQVAPPAELQGDVQERFERSVSGVEVENRYVRMVKIGRHLYVLCQLVMPPSFRLQRVKDLDEIRARIAEGLGEVHPKLVLDVVFTEQPISGTPGPLRVLLQDGRYGQLREDIHRVKTADGTGECRVRVDRETGAGALPIHERTAVGDATVIDIELHDRRVQADHGDIAICVNRAADTTSVRFQQAGIIHNAEVTGELAARPVVDSDRPITRPRIGQGEWRGYRSAVSEGCRIYAGQALHRRPTVIVAAAQRWHAHHDRERDSRQSWFARHGVPPLASADTDYG